MTAANSCRQVLVLAAICGSLGVLIGAFGAHGLPDLLAQKGLPDEIILKRMSQFDIAARYHLIHAVALLALSAIPMGSDSRRRIIAWLFVVGIILFSGSLYLLALTGQTKLGAVTPIGGITWIVAWLSLVCLPNSATKAGCN